jgi:hypothetical protein
MCQRTRCLVLSVFSLLMLAGTAHADLVGHWKLDSDTEVLDSSGQGNDGTIVGSPTLIEGMQGGALEFHGQGAAIGGADHINCGTSPSMTINSRISITMWIKPGADDPEGNGTETAPMCKALSSASPSWSWQVRYGWGSPQPYMAFTFNTSPRAWAYVGQNLEKDEWAHIACSHDGSTLTSYLNGVVAESTAMGNITISPAPVLIGSDGWGSDWIGGIDDLRLYDHGLSPEEIIETMMIRPAELSSDPMPETEAVDVPRDVILAWSPGVSANTHDVYLGQVFEDVNDATTDTSLGVLVSQGQDSTYEPSTVLEFGKAYYWRVDEVNGAPDYTVYKGEVWTFTVEPLAIPIENITASASGANLNMGPENTINGSGLNDLDQHSADPTTMWLAGGPEPIWIQYDFDKAYKLNEMLVWNSNQAIEAFIGFGTKEVTVEYTADGETWTALDGPATLAQAPGVPTYTANSAVDLGGVLATSVKLTVVSAHGMTGQNGLSEVRFMAIPTYPRDPQPADGGTSDSVEVSLQWRSGREAASHQVSFGSTPDTLTPLDTPQAAVALTYVLDYGTTYYWSATEVNDAADPSTYAGATWSFTTPVCGVVEDFESYSKEIDEEIYMTWLDGFGGDASLGGSTTGHIDSPFVETTIVNPGTGGKKSMPVYYDNDGGFANIDGNVSSPNFSEVMREFGAAQDWTVSGITMLSIAFQGTTDNTGQLYCKIGDTKVLYSGPAEDIGKMEWTEWKIDLATVGGNLTNVRQVAIGIEGGGSGLVYIDDMCLYP